ncbi:MAG: ATP-binding protein [Candidatus Heimdallarchaeota archaeon]|nr:ATP-binding protein [Candidatus Heimdallarchaeota archaeon]
MVTQTNEFWLIRKQLLEDLEKENKELTEERRDCCREIGDKLRSVNSNEQRIIIKIDSENEDNYQYQQRLRNYADSKLEKRIRDDQLSKIFQQISNSDLTREITKHLEGESNNATELLESAGCTRRTILKLIERDSNMMTVENPNLTRNVFSEHLLLIEEAIDEDIVAILVNILGNEQNAEELSDGQKCSVMMTLAMLSKENVPLIVDQPEDDLDHEFISKNIIPKIVESKKTRQYILSTHNPNISALGDSETIFKLEYKGEDDSCFIESSGGFEDLLEDLLRMEGGESAFRLRMERYGFNRFSKGIRKI